MTSTTFHDGEREVQTRVGVASRMAELGPRVIRDFMPEQHRAFFAQLPDLIVGALDAQGQPWASILVRPPGFIASPDPRTLVLRSQPLPGDPLASSLVDGAPIGLLGIEPHTRRRNRVNGVVRSPGAGGFGVEVKQSFGNCPKYIQAREPVLLPLPPRPGTVVDSTTLDAAARRLVASADTLFIATASAGPDRGEANQGVDVSHRGGKPGFVRVDSDDRGDTLTMPDFAGNLFFNTLGNIAVNPRAGLLFIDFSNGDLLYVAVAAEIIWDGAELAAFDGAQRLVRCKVTGMRRLPAALPLRWSAAGLSPFLAATGAWPQSPENAPA